MDARLVGLVSHWCHDSSAQKAGLASVLQRQLNEASIAVRQVGLEEKRLGSEARLANSTRLEKERQLEDAASTANLALAEFQNEQQRMERTIKAAAHAMTLIETREAQRLSDPDAGKELDPGMSRLPTDVEVLGLGVLGDDEALSRPQQLLQHLRQLHAQLTQERNAAVLEHKTMLQKLWSFTDHVNSSIMETQSQVAAISMEVAQRKREHARLNGRIAGLTALLRAVNASSTATEAICGEEERHQGEIALYVMEESTAVKALMRQMPAAAPYLATTGNALSFIQVSGETSHMLAVQRALDDIDQLARRFPRESAWYSVELKRLALAHEGPKSNDAHNGGDGPREAGHGPAGQEGEDNDPLKNIRQFVREGVGVNPAGKGGGSNKGGAEYEGNQMPSMDEVRGVFTGVLSRVRAKAHSLNENHSRCTSLLRDAAVVGAALGRSAKRVAAKLHIAEATIAEYTRSYEYNRAQRKLLAGQLQQLTEVGQEMSRQSAGALQALRGNVQRLVSVAAGMQGTQIYDSQSVRNLIQKVEEHQSLLHRRATRFTEQASAVDSADRTLLRLLDEDAEQSRRRLVRVKAEFRLLATRAQAKADDQALSSHFQELAGGLCSKERLAQLKGEAELLEKEEEALQKATPTAVPA